VKRRLFFATCLAGLVPFIGRRQPKSKRKPVADHEQVVELFPPAPGCCIKLTAGEKIEAYDAVYIGDDGKAYRVSCERVGVAK